MTANLYIGGIFQSDKGIIGGNLKIAKERASNEMYYRTKVSGSITFLKDDYQALYEMDLDTRCEVQLIDGGLIAKAHFFKTDCEFDVDNGICTLKPKFVDNYEKLLQGIDNKENITRLECPINTIQGYKRGIIQFYMHGDKKITNVIGNMSYEIDAEEERDAEKLQRMPSQGGFGFTAFSTWGIYSFYIPASQFIPQAVLDIVNGDYFGNSPQSYQEGSARFRNRQTGAYFTITSDAYQSATLYSASGEAMGAVNINGWNGLPVITDFQRNEYAFTEVATMPRFVYARYLTDKATANAEERLAEDISGENLNYRYVEKITSGILPNVRFIQSTDVQDDPTEWGRDSQGKYFVKPTAGAPFNNPRVIPFARSLWSPTTYWLISDITLADHTDARNEAFFCKDAYAIIDVLRRLIDKVDESILGVQSEFLEPTLNHPMFDVFDRFTKWWITPITNIKKTYYEQAAQKGDISIQDILKMLRALGLYWHLENTRYGYVMRIEHYLWYRNGGSYVSDTRTPIISLGNVTSPKLGKPWSFGQNKVSWDLDKPKRLEFAWQSECTEEFNGYPLEIKNAYMENGSKDTISAGVFIPDIDLVIASPGEVSDDCFALFMTNRVANQNVIPLVDANIPGATPLVRMQNGYLSYLWIEQNLLKYGLGGNRYAIENAEFTENKTARMRKQDVVFPIGWDSLQEYGLIETPMGKGEMIKVEWDVESHKASATIKLDNE